MTCKELNQLLNLMAFMIGERLNQYGPFVASYAKVEGDKAYN